MTPQEQKLLAYLRTYIAEHEFSPSYGECAEHLGVVSKSGVLRVARSLLRQGHISMEPNRSRSMRPVERVGATAITAALLAEHGVYEDDDHEDKLIICTPAEALATVLRVLGA